MYNNICFDKRQDRKSCVESSTVWKNVRAVITMRIRWLQRTRAFFQNLSVYQRVGEWKNKHKKKKKMFFFSFTNNTQHEHSPGVKETRSVYGCSDCEWRIVIRVRITDLGQQPAAPGQRPPSPRVRARIRREPSDGTRRLERKKSRDSSDDRMMMNTRSDINNKCCTYD